MSAPPSAPGPFTVDPQRPSEVRGWVRIPAADREHIVARMAEVQALFPGESWASIRYRVFNAGVEALVPVKRPLTVTVPIARVDADARRWFDEQEWDAEPVAVVVDGGAVRVAWRERE